MPRTYRALVLSIYVFISLCLSLLLSLLPPPLPPSLPLSLPVLMMRIRLQVIRTLIRARSPSPLPPHASLSLHLSVHPARALPLLIKPQLWRRVQATLVEPLFKPLWRLIMEAHPKGMPAWKPVTLTRQWVFGGGYQRGAFRLDTKTSQRITTWRFS